MYIFDMNNPFFRFVGRVVDLIWINLLTLICCLPIVTIGASLSAMYSVLLKLVMKEEVGLTVTFFKSFRLNLKKSTVLWIPSAVFLLGVSYNAYLLRQGALDSFGDFKTVVAVSICLLLAIIVMFVIYSQALLARYENTIKQTAENAFLLMFANFMKSVSMVIICMSPIALMVLSNWFFYLWVLYGFALPGYFIAMILSRVFVTTEKIQNDK